MRLIKSMSQLQQALDEYKEAHRHPTNRLIHKICVPLIVLSFLGLLKSLPGRVDWSYVVVLTALYYSARFKNWRLFVCFGAFLGLCEILLNQIIYPFWPSLGVFAAAWAGQFYGHKLEGRQPAFLENIMSLFIGPIWVMYWLIGDERD